jgi:hypothetical protein
MPEALASGTGTGGYGELLLGALVVAFLMPASALAALYAGYRAVRSALDWGWVGVAALVLLVPYLAAFVLAGSPEQGVVVARALLVLPFAGGALSAGLPHPMAAFAIAVAVAWRLLRPATSPSPRPPSRADESRPPRGRLSAAAIVLSVGVAIVLVLSANCPS